MTPIQQRAEISVVMSAYNAGKFIKEAIESILMQSFADFELIIVDDGSTDDTRSMIRAFRDKRIILIQNEHDFTASLNKGLHAATGKYIARMDADDIMHVDRLQMQYTIMEFEPELTVCGSWVSPFGEKMAKGKTICSYSGCISTPLLQLLRDNFIYNSTTMLRASFLKQHSLQYECYPYAEDYKLWTEIAKYGGQFYIESFPLVSYRLSMEQVGQQHKEEQKCSTWAIQREIADTLLNLCEGKYEIIDQIYRLMLKLNQEKLISEQQITSFLFETIQKTTINRKHERI